ncbi:MAG: chemotaxis response regulator protein-glutamate methylesterase [Candidatus Micrarchaeota archaeon]|nr:chemotaxis response regulator protein-glutamate methylesterase [Candidatus Micrarchaeota archaeon]
MRIPTLIVDDTVTYRKILSEAAQTFPEIEVIGTAASGAIALQKMAQTKVTLVLLDIHMPEMDGVETLRRIKKDYPDTFVVMVSGISTRGAETTIQALQMGAIDFIRKPDGKSAEENFRHLIEDLRPVVRLVNTRLQLVGGKAKKSDTLPKGIETKKPPISIKKNIYIKPSIVAIGVSTGGPEALARLIPQLPADLPVPVVLVQHMPPLFTKSLADSLAKKSKVKVVEATEGEPLKNGVVYIAPGGKHMVVRRKEDGSVVIGLNDGPPENSCKPSVDVLFRSVASVYEQKGILAVILTGMGNDGCAGVRTCKRNYCYCITQNEATCVVYGMPKAVDDAGLSDISLPLDKIAEEIVLKVKKG